MIVERLLAALAAATAIAAASAVAVVAAAFTVYALAEPHLGKAGAAAVVAVVFALLAALAGFLAARRAKGADTHESRQGSHDAGLLVRLMEMMRDRPLIAISAGIAAAILAFRNPILVAAIVKAFMDPRPGPK